MTSRARLSGFARLNLPTLTQRELKAGANVSGTIGRGV